MFLKFRFKNHSCFKEWQEIDLSDQMLLLDKICSSKVSGILGDNSSGKTSVIKLLKTTISHLMHFLNYEKEMELTVKKQTMASNSNPFMFNVHLDPFNKNVDEINANDEFAKFNTQVELWFVNELLIYKYELSFNHLFCDYELLSIADNNGDNEQNWKYLYQKRNLTFDVINREETCVYNIDVDKQMLQLNKEPMFTNLNKKNSLISYLKSISNSKILIDLSNYYSNFVFVSDLNTLGLFKTYTIDKDYLLQNKDKFIDALNKIGFNISDYSVNPINLNSFYLMIAKRDANNRIMYINSENESETLNKVIHILYYAFIALENKQVLVIDNISRSLNNDIIAFLVNMFNQQEENFNNAQLLITLNNKYENDLVGICQSTSLIESDTIQSNIKRIL